MSRVPEMPIFQQQKVEVAAKVYNLWRRARLHMKFPIRFALRDFRGLVMILDKNEWLCADETNNDFPVLCWLEFDDHGRDALHVPVQCTLNYYHFAADKIELQVLQLMQETLEQMLQKNYKG